MRVTLTYAEMQAAAITGVNRRLDSIRRNLKGAADYNGQGRGEWQIDILGAMSEAAVAKALGVWWDYSIGTFKLPDVENLQVRSTEYSDGRLLIRPHDPKGFYVLVVTKPPVFTVCGFCSLEFAKQDQFFTQPDKSRTPCWAVPQSHLAPIEWIYGKQDSQILTAQQATS